MSQKNIVLSCVWRADDFVVSDSRIDHSDDEAVLTINEKTEKITVQIPTHLSLVSKKIIERRVNSIAKSGFPVPKTHIRIGVGFEVEITKEEVIPDVLLQEGHKYSLERPITPIETPSKPTRIIEETTESEYIPTFLSQEVSQGEAPPPTRPEPIELPSKEPITTYPPEMPEQPFDDNESIAGRFVVNLSRTGDVYLTQKEDHYSVEYSAGRVDFRVRHGDIEIIMTKRIAADDKTLNQAISAATGKKL
ncbi:MAG: hypothetical protein JSV04_00705 [Candidatus Heimdallarchaeota archaeon]|nr:MAG: hypothetical protein JSV04_00705 [Candidatus Heimdallarchaeota archaeon]